MQGKLKPLPRDKVLKILVKNGFEVVKGIKGKHYHLRKRMQDGIVLTTIVSHRPLIEPRFIKMIIEQTEIPEEEFY